MKKRISILLCFALMATMLAGCMRVEADVEFKSDGSWTCTQTMAVSEQFLASMGSIEDAANEMELVVIDGENYYRETQVVSGASLVALTSDVISTDPEYFGVNTWIENGKQMIGIKLKLDSSEITTEGMMSGLTGETGESTGAGVDVGVSSDMTYEELASAFKCTLTFTVPQDLQVIKGDQKYFTINGNSVSIDVIPEEPMPENTEFEFRGVITDNIPTENTDSHFAKVATYNGQFKDVASNAWYAEAVGQAYESGFISGVSADSFNPNSAVTIAEMLVMAARVRSSYLGDSYSFTSTGSSAWYTPYVEYLQREGVITQNTFVDYEVPATRGDMAFVFSQVLPYLTYINGTSSDVKVSIPDVAVDDDRYPYVNVLYRAGIVTGVDSVGTFLPDNNLTRAEIAVILTRLAYSSTRSPIMG